MDPVLERIREELLASRRAGVTFDAAWRAAVHAALRTSSSRGERPPRGDQLLQWTAALAGTRDAWRAAYTADRPATRSERAALVLMGAPADEPLEFDATIPRALLIS